MSEKLIRNKLYPVVDCPTKPLKGNQEWRARWTGEKRPPLKGEYYLSGSVIQAYRSPGSNWSYPIAELVKVRRETIFIVES